MKEPAISGYRYRDAGLNHSHGFLVPAVIRLLKKVEHSSTGGEEISRRLFELGCGNGSVANALTQAGWAVTGVDPSIDAIRHARSAYPHLKLELDSAYEDLAARYHRFPVVLSLEVVEHVYAPRDYARTLFDLVAEGGVAILSTPYHGYWKNLALAVTGKMDAHFTALWDHGHIKFWSIRTLGELLRETGFVDIRFERVGRIPPLAKSMLVIARKP
ncbi:MAG: class I SAM-dependent methyltransferase [Chromatiaceae bacterium]|nr:class I SAM-dependent methyltransferase [Chromatiaceae bacterium]